MSDSPSSTKPYLIRAIHEWCTDNGLTPYLAVSVTDDVQVPKDHVRNGEIVLNISMLATDRLQITNTEVSFQARFSGRVNQILVPIENVVAIYAKETGNGMAFEVAKPLADDAVVSPVATIGPALAQAPSALDDGPEPPRPTGGRPKLTRVK